MKGRSTADDDAGRAEAIAVLRAGGIVALPTDTVYGLAVALETPRGLERLFAAKRRPLDKSIGLLLADAAQAGSIAILTPVALALAAVCWPGGLTLVVAKRPDVVLPDALTGGSPTGGSPTIGLRVPDHPTPRALAAVLGPLPTTSANRSGLPEAGDAATILDELGDAIDLVLDGGPAGGGPASTVVDCSGPVVRVLRVGAVPVERLGAVLAAAGLSLSLEPVLRAPR